MFLFYFCSLERVYDPYRSICLVACSLFWSAIPDALISHLLQILLAFASEIHSSWKCALNILVQLPTLERHFSSLNSYVAPPTTRHGNSLATERSSAETRRLQLEVLAEERWRRIGQPMGFRQRHPEKSLASIGGLGTSKVLNRF